MEICYLLAFPDPAEINSQSREQLLGWVLLLVGYLYLYMLDAGWINFP
jgi:hypothetical protein